MPAILHWAYILPLIVNVHETIVIVLKCILYCYDIAQGKAKQYTEHTLTRAQ